MYDVIALGELLIDFAAKETDADGYPTMKANPGGAPGNFLAALNKYGMKTAFLGKVGDDAFGKLLVKTFEKAGIETKGILTDPSVFTTLAFVTFSPEGDRSFSFARKPGADTRLSFEEIDLTMIDEASVFHFGTLSLTDDPVRTATKKCVEYAKEHGKLITFDPNLRLPLWETTEAAKEQILWGLAHADVVKISDEEVEFLWGITDEKEAAGSDRPIRAQPNCIRKSPRHARRARQSRRRPSYRHRQILHRVQTRGGQSVVTCSVALAERIHLPHAAGKPQTCL